MLCADGGLVEPAALRRRPLDHLAALGGQPLVEGAVGDPGAHQLGDGRPEGLAVRPPRLPEEAGGHAVLLTGQPQQEVFAAHNSCGPAGLHFSWASRMAPRAVDVQAVIRHIDRLTVWMD